MSEPTHVFVVVVMVVVVAVVGGFRQKKAVASFLPVWRVCHTPFCVSSE